MCHIKCFSSGLLLLSLFLTTFTNADRQPSLQRSDYKLTRIKQTQEKTALNVQDLLEMTDKRLNSKTFFSPRGKKGSLSDNGFYGVRGKKSLSPLSSDIYMPKDFSFLRKLYPGLWRVPHLSVSGSKRLDASSFFGVRGKRPVLGSSNLSGLAVKETVLPFSGRGGEEKQKRQPPPGFYALRG